MHILIIGGAGMVGRKLAERLAKDKAVGGKPIARPDWIESSPGRISFLWFCRACDYRFEAIAIYDEADPDALAA